MKADITTVKPEFQPKTLNIVFETQEEFDLIKHMLSWNVSIPALMYNSSSIKQEKLEYIMSKLHQLLIKS